MRKLAIIGASGHGRVVADIARKNGYSEIVFLDDDENIHECGGYPVTGKSAEAGMIDADVIVGIGNASVRRRIQESIPDEKLIILIHPDAVVAEDIVIGTGTVVMAGTVINPGARIGKGCIINTASAIALKGVFGRALYSATKGAILSLSRSMAREYVQDGIRVNCISPSTVLTPSLQERINASSSPEEAMATFVSRHPIGRLGTCEEIAAAILYLASDQAGFITAANLVLDGGMTM